MRRGTRRERAAVIAAAIVTAGAAAAAASPSSEGSAPTTPAGWALTPAGRVITVANGPGLGGPWGVAIAPDGGHALVTSSGQAVQDETMETFDLTAGTRTDVQVYNGHRGRSVFYGVAYSPDGQRAWASGGGQGVVHAFDVAADGSLKPSQTIPAGNFPAGLAYGRTPLGTALYVADNLGGAPFTTGSYEDPPGHEVRVIDPSTTRSPRRSTSALALDPFGVAFNTTARRPTSRKWTGRSVAVIDTVRRS